MDLLAEYRRGVLLRRTSFPAEAAKVLAPIVAAEPGNAQARLELALAYFASAQLAHAEAELRVLVERDPSDHYAHHVLGRTLERLNRPAEALPHLRLAAAMSSMPDYDVACARVAANLAGR